MLVRCCRRCRSRCGSRCWRARRRALATISCSIRRIRSSRACRRRMWRSGWVGCEARSGLWARRCGGSRGCRGCIEGAASRWRGRRRVRHLSLRYMRGYGVGLLDDGVRRVRRLRGGVHGMESGLREHGGLIPCGVKWGARGCMGASVLWLGG